MAQIQPPSSNYIPQGRHGNFNAVDYAGRTSRFIPVMNNRNIYAVEDGTITKYGYEGNMGNRLELTSADGKRRWGMGHLESSSVPVGTVVKRGQLIGVMGHTGLTIPKGYFGTHLHLVCLTGGKYVYPPTIMNMPFSIYTPPANNPMPSVGGKVRFSTSPRTCFNPETTNVSGTLRNDGKSTHTVRGIDPKFPNRIMIFTKSGGSKSPTDYKSVALYYTNGVRIPGWEQL